MSLKTLYDQAVGTILRGVGSRKAAGAFSFAGLLLSMGHIWPTVALVGVYTLAEAYVDARQGRNATTPQG